MSVPCPPIYLPDGHIMFTTTRGNSYVRCGPFIYSYILARCDAGGGNVYLISHNGEPDFVPALLNDGRVLTGLVIESSADQITFVDAKQQKTTVARDEIDQLHPSETSLMPEGVLETLQPQEIRDLFSYLESDRPAVQSARKK